MPICTFDVVIFSTSIAKSRRGVVGKLVLTKSLMMATLMSGLFNYKKKKKKKRKTHEAHAQITNIRHLRLEASEPVWLNEEKVIC